MGSTVPPAAEGRTLDRDAARFGRNAEPFILLILHEGRSYGYEIRSRLEGFGFRRAAREPGVVYRLLHSLEEAVLIESEGDLTPSGTGRAYYRRTKVRR